MLQQTRFDLIFKYIYATSKADKYATVAYLESIYAFNKFHEYEWKNNEEKTLVKYGPLDYINIFD
jgi:hypothetical protein